MNLVNRWMIVNNVFLLACSIKARRFRKGYKMTCSKFPLAVAACSIMLLLTPAIVMSQSAEIQQRVAALKQSVAHDQQSIRHYE
jgi:hypothetical protein